MQITTLISTFKALIPAVVQNEFQAPILNLFEELSTAIQNTISEFRTQQQAHLDLREEMANMTQDRDRYRNLYSKKPLAGRGLTMAEADEYEDMLRILRNLIPRQSFDAMDSHETVKFIKQYIDKGQRVVAIKQMRRLTDKSLKQCKDWVDNTFPKPAPDAFCENQNCNTCSPA